MSESPSIDNLRSQLTSLRDEVMEFYAEVGKAETQLVPETGTSVEDRGDDDIDDGTEYAVEMYRQSDVGKRLTSTGRETADDLAHRLRILMVQLGSFVKSAALMDEADLRGLGLLTKKMAAALRFRRYKHWGIYIHNDEGTVLGVDPPKQSEDELISLREAHRIFAGSYREVMEMTDLIAFGDRTSAVIAEHGSIRIRPGTAFVIMQISTLPELDDVLTTVREVFKKFGVKAIRSDEIEHGGFITARILDEITTSEYIFVDLSGERPNVYYEVGFAHAVKKNTILYRKKGARIHFDLAAINCPEYQTVTDLRNMLHKRLSAITGKVVPETY